MKNNKFKLFLCIALLTILSCSGKQSSAIRKGMPAWFYERESADFVYINSDAESSDLSEAIALVYISAIAHYQSTLSKQINKILPNILSQEILMTDKKHQRVVMDKAYIYSSEWITGTHIRHQHNFENTDGTHVALLQIAIPKSEIYAMLLHLFVAPSVVADANDDSDTTYELTESPKYLNPVAVFEKFATPEMYRPKWYGRFRDRDRLNFYSFSESRRHEMSDRQAHARAIQQIGLFIERFKHLIEGTELDIQNFTSEDSYTGILTANRESIILPTGGYRTYIQLSIPDRIIIEKLKNSLP
jgi:hypothetical protein